VDPESECYWMTDQIRVLLEAVPEPEWTPALNAAWELRQDFHDAVCRWQSLREEGKPAGAMPDPQAFRLKMVPFGFGFLTVQHVVQYREDRRVA
jgi:hypothetical protein